jgi:molecular chaperone DnaJ
MAAVMAIQHGRHLQSIWDVFGEDVFGSFFGGGGGRTRSGQRARGTRGSNLRIKLKLTYEEIAKGVTKNIKVKKYVAVPLVMVAALRIKDSIQNCTSCGGSGQVRKVTSTF